jgi:hypothetical protein
MVIGCTAIRKTYVLSSLEEIQTHSQVFFVICPIFDNIQIPVSQLFFVLCPIFDNIQIPVSNLKKTNIEYMGSFDVMQVNIKPNLRNKRVGLERL